MHDHVELDIDGRDADNHGVDFFQVGYPIVARGFQPEINVIHGPEFQPVDLTDVKLTDAEIKEINGQYHKLRAYPDVVGALKDLKSQGLTIKIVANPTKQMITDHSEFAGTLPYIDEIISSGEEAQAFKPSPRVYQLGVERAGCAKEDILWVTGHQWEAFGAVRQGLQVAWTNRARDPKLPIGIDPTYTTKNLQELADILAAESSAGVAAA